MKKRSGQDLHRLVSFKGRGLNQSELKSAISEYAIMAVEQTRHQSPRTWQDPWSYASFLPFFTLFYTSYGFSSTQVYISQKCPWVGKHPSRYVFSNLHLFNVLRFVINTNTFVFSLDPSTRCKNGKTANHKGNVILSLFFVSLTNVLFVTAII